jgi:RND family efflux transporter MFP subunit
LNNVRQIRIRQRQEHSMKLASHLLRARSSVRLSVAVVSCLAPLMRLPAQAEKSDGTENVPVVAAVRIERGEISREVTFDAELRPYQEVELHARVTGYIDVMKVEAGDSVKEGDVLAVLDSPESKIEIEHALASERRSKAEIARAEAAFDEAHTAYDRLIKTSEAQPRLIAQQDIDAAKARDRAASAALDAAREQANVSIAEVKKLQTMLDYTRITAPFTGVITKRYRDPGSLIQAGTSSGTLPLVRLSQNDKLRVVFPVSISYVSAIKVGDPVEIRIAALDRTISGAVARFSRKVETSTRTMDAEIEVPNADLSLIPGIYASATLKTDRHEKALVVPIEAVSRDKGGATVFVIGGGNRLEERNVTLGVETPTKLEILGGVNEGDIVMIGSRTQIAPGQVVQPKLPDAPVKTVKAN